MKDEIIIRENKISIPEMIGLALIVLIFLYFPYVMISEHSLDIQANSLYLVKYKKI